MKKLLLISLLALFTAGCKDNLLVEVTKYKSYPSFYYEKERNFEDERLKKLKDNEILLNVSVTGIGSQIGYRIYFHPYSLKKSESILIKKATLTSVKKVSIEEFYNNEVFLKNFNNNHKTYYGSLELFKFSKEKMQELTKDGNASLEIFYEFPDTGETRSKIFEIERYEYHDIAWPT